MLLVSKRNLIDDFFIGAKEGIKSTVNLIPNLCLLTVAISMLSSSGALDIISKILYPVFDFLKIPKDILPLIITRPLSFGASVAAYENLIERCGIDSIETICASIIMASSDTTLYVISVYFSATSIKKTRYTIPIALTVSILSIFLSCLLGRLLFE
ncbi:MAG: spore maturation protein [Clostridia bacterium]|nr:spore maturation protein [Clostridia bacterium]